MRIGALLPVDGAAVCGEVGQLVEDGPLPDDGVRQARVPIELHRFKHNNCQRESKRIVGHVILVLI